MKRYEENPTGLSVAVIAAGLVGAAYLFFGRKSEATSSCSISAAKIDAFGKELKYAIYTSQRPVSSWTPKASDEYAAATNGLKVFSAADCSFYRWDGKSWSKDASTNNELTAFTSPPLSGASHPYVGLSVPT